MKKNPIITLSRIEGEKYLKIGVFFLLAWIVIGNLLVLSYGNDDIRMVYTFSSDEKTILEKVLNNITNNDLDPRGEYNYGYCYQTVGFIISKTLAHFGFQADTRLAALVLRLISWGSFIMVGILLYKLFTGPFKGSKEFALILVLIFLSLPAISQWSRIIHPDMFQLAWIILAAWLAFSKHTAARLFLASAAAGLAFGTKYSGIFILPFLFLPYLFQHCSSSPSLKNIKFWLKIVCTGMITVLIFLFMWLLTNPYAIINFQEFQKVFFYVKKFVATSPVKLEPANPLLWFQVLWQQLGPVICTIAAVGIAAALGTLISTLKKKGWKKFYADPLNRTLAATILYIIVSFIYLLACFRFREVRYMFHILPFIILVALWGLSRICTFFQKGSAGPNPSGEGALRRPYGWGNILIIMILFFYCIIPTTHSISQAAVNTKKYDHPRLKSGSFLNAHVDSHLIILANPYNYIPPKFSHVTFRYRIDKKQIKMFRPDIIILNYQATHRYSWKRKGTSFQDLDFIQGSYARARDCYRFHKRLFSPTSRWKIIYETYDVVILKKKNI